MRNIPAGIGFMLACDFNLGLGLIDLICFSRLGVETWHMGILA
jgi:hypothetical protein